MGRPAKGRATTTVAPTIILVRPQLGENIGMAARAMLNCGLSSLRLVAPLAANVNDKACAFGGSLAGVMTLAGWGWLMLRAQAAGLPSEVYVADSQVRYLAPLFDDLVAEARLRGDQDWDAIVRTLGERRRASATMQCRVCTADGTVAATLEARFALKRVDAA